MTVVIAFPVSGTGIINVFSTILSLLYVEHSLIYSVTLNNNNYGESLFQLFTENITKTYKKSDITQYNSINTEAKIIAEHLGIDDRLERLALNAAFITKKDHKDNFVNNPQCRLMNPAKPELGKVGKLQLDDIDSRVRNATLVHQWHSTNDVIEWFKSIPDKNICTFI